MTIAAGFNCNDGVVLASDSLYSGSNGHRYGHKFWSVRSDPDLQIVFGGAGLEGGLRRTRDEIKRRLRANMTRDDAVDCVDEALAHVAQKLPQDDVSKTHALVAIRTDGMALLYENSGGTNLLSTVDHPSQCVGYDMALGLYFTRSLFRAGMSSNFAKFVAAFLIKTVKGHSDYSGGPTVMFEIPHVGPARLIERLPEISVYEAHLEPIDEIMQSLITEGDDMTRVANRITIIRNTITALRALRKPQAT